MLNEWTDRMPSPEAAELWQRRIDEEVSRRVARIERELRNGIEQQPVPIGFYDAMRHFLKLREKLFPGLAADPILKLLVTLAQTPDGSAKASLTGIAHGADVPMTTALRYMAVMEAEGIVERVANPADRRQTMVRLTREGRHRLDALAEKWAIRAIWIAGLPAAVLLWASGAHVAF